MPTPKQGEILELAAKGGKTLSGAAHIAGCSVLAAENYAREKDLSFARNSKTPVSEEALLYAKKRREEGASWGDISQETGCARSTIRAGLARLLKVQEQSIKPEEITENELTEGANWGEFSTSGSAEIATAIRMHAEAITKLAEAIALAATAGKETVIKLKTDKGVTLASDTGLTLYKVERRCPDWEHKTEKQESKEETK